MGEFFFNWEKAYDTGIASIDTQHKVIIKILNELYDVVLVNKEEYKLADILNELVQYTVYHFEEEEKLMSKFNYDDFKQHKVEHQMFIEKIQSLGEGLNQGQPFLAFDLIEFLKDWLIEHIMEADQGYVRFYKKNGINI
jgi:hemerythrin-like metal-binding protein